MDTCHHTCLCVETIRLTNYFTNGYTQVPIHERKHVRKSSGERGPRHQFAYTAAYEHLHSYVGEDKHLSGASLHLSWFICREASLQLFIED
jgi:hypothetical protein